jgi:hypothetical protein
MSDEVREALDAPGPRPRAADDFAEIRRRMTELAAESAPESAPNEGPTNLKGETIGGCDVCKRDCVPCRGCFRPEAIQRGLDHLSERWIWAISPLQG